MQIMRHAGNEFHCVIEGKIVTRRNTRIISQQQVNTYKAIQRQIWCSCVTRSFSHDKMLLLLDFLFSQVHTQEKGKSSYSEARGNPTKVDTYASLT